MQQIWRAKTAMRRIARSFWNVITPREVSNDLVTTDDRIRLHNSYMDLTCSQQHLNDFESVKGNAED